MTIRFHDPSKSLSEAKESLTFANLLAVELLAQGVKDGSVSMVKVLMGLPSIAHKFATATDKEPIRVMGFGVAAEEPVLLYGLTQGKFGYSACWLPQWIAQAQTIMSDVSADLPTRLYIAKAMLNNPEFDYSDKIVVRGNFTPTQLKELGIAFEQPIATTPKAKVTTDPNTQLAELAQKFGGVDGLLEALANLGNQPTSQPAKNEPVLSDASPVAPKAKNQNRK